MFLQNIGSEYKTTTGRESLIGNIPKATEDSYNLYSRNQVRKDEIPMKYNRESIYQNRTQIPLYSSPNRDSIRDSSVRDLS